MPVHIPGLTHDLLREFLAMKAAECGFSPAVVARLRALPDEKIKQAWAALERFFERYSPDE